MENIETLDVVQQDLIAESNAELAAESILSREVLDQDETDIGAEGLVEAEATVH